MVSWGMEMVALGWNCIIEHGDNSMGVQISGLQQVYGIVEMGEATFCHYSLHGTIPMPPLHHFIFHMIVQCYYLCAGCCCYCLCLVIFCLLPVISKNKFLTIYLLLFLHLYWRKCKGRWFVLGKCFSCSNIIITWGLGVLGWYHQDCRVVMEASGWSCFDAAVLFSHEIWIAASE